MLILIKSWMELNSDKRAVTALEYGMIAALIAGVAGLAFTGLGTHLNTLLGTVNTAL